MALTMTACGGSSSGSDDSNAASGSDSGSAGSYKVGIVQLVQHEALDAATQGFQDKLKDCLLYTSVENAQQRRHSAGNLHVLLGTEMRILPVQQLSLIHI